MVDFKQTGEKRMPRNVEAERSVLGALLLHADSVADVSHILRPEDFYSPRHQLIFRAILDTYDSHAHCDPIAVEERLSLEGKLDEAGGKDELLNIAGSVISAGAVTYHAEIVRDKAILRQLLDTCIDVQRQAYDNSALPTELLDEAESRIFQIANLGSSSEPSSVTDVLMQTIDRLEKLRGQNVLCTGVETSFLDIDEKTSGLQPGELIIVAARPSMGKTSLALNLMERIASMGNGVAFFSLEMSAQQIVQNMLCCRAQVDGLSLRRGFISEQEFKRIQDEAAQLYEAPLFIDDSAGLTISSFRAKCRRLKQKHDIKMVVVDYLQLMNAGGRVESRQQEIASISRTLKAVARELGVPVVALSQLNRDVENRENNKPRMSDLRESGAIEQDADVIMLLHREEYFKPTEENRGLAQVIIAKQRNGPTGEITLRFFREYMRFENFQRRPEPMV